MTTQNIPISQVPVAVALDGSEEVPIVQAGVTKRTTTSAIGDLRSSVSYYVIASTPFESDVHTGDTSVATFYSLTIPANTLSANGGALIIDLLYSYVGTNGTKTPIILFGGTTFFSLAVAATVLATRIRLEIVNRGSLGTVIGSSTNLTFTGSSLLPVITATIDVTQDQTLLLQGQLGSGSDSIAIEWYRIGFINPA